MCTNKLWEDNLGTASIYFKGNEDFGQKHAEKDQIWSRFHFIRWQRKPGLGSIDSEQQAGYLNSWKLVGKALWTGGTA